MKLTRDTEHALLALMLDTEARKRARATIRPRWIFDEKLARLLEVAFAWDVDHETELTVHGWAKLYAQREEIPLEAAGELIAECCLYSGAAVNLDAYADLIREDWERRTIAGIGREIVVDGRDPACSPLDLASKANSIAEVVRERRSDSITGEQALAEAAMRSRSGEVRTGFPDLDRLLIGMSPGDLVTVAARTSIGKTAFAVDIMRNLASDVVPVGYVTLEMDPAEVYSRMIRIPTPISVQPRFWFPKRRCTVDAIAAQAMNWAADSLGLLIVDHLGLVSGASNKRSKYEETTENVHDLKRLARTLEVPILMLSQLSRAVTARQDRFPELSDLRDSGAIEEDSDAVILLHRPGYYDANHDQSEAWASLAKHRHGRTGVVRLHWDPEGGNFSSMMPSMP